MSLRKPPALTPALPAANRRNVQKSTGPCTPPGKAWPRLNHLKHREDWPQYLRFINALLLAPPGQVALPPQALLASREVCHPLFLGKAELAIQVEIDLCGEARMRRLGRG